MSSRQQKISLWLGDCIARMKLIPDNSIGGSATDPPYLIGFMNKKWDVVSTSYDETTSDSAEVDAEEEALTTEEIHENEAFHILWLTELFRILQPGGIAKVFAATRTMHRLAAAMENVGCVLDPTTSLEAWCYGSGFPKSLNISKGLDAYLAHGRSDSTVTGTGARDREGLHWSAFPNTKLPTEDKPLISEISKKYEGWGTAMKPAWEPFVVGRKPL